MLEIERKFLVKSTQYQTLYTTKYQITQGYLNTDPHRTVRVRIKGEKGYITIKGISDTAGVTRFEWEKEIPLNEAQSLVEMCEEGIIDKIRYEVMHEGHLYEIDEFNGNNAGLVVGEIELNAEDEHFTKPDWLGEEVTGNNKYYNSYLSQKPYKDW